MIVRLTKDQALVREWSSVRRLTDALNAHGPNPFLMTREFDRDELVQWERELTDLMGALEIAVEELREKTVDKIKDAPVVAF